MVLKTLASLSKYASNTAHTSSPHPPFFDPSYLKQQKLTVIDSILNKNSKNNTASNPHPILSTTSNYIVFDPNLLKNDNGNNKKDSQKSKDTILLIQSKTNKNDQNLSYKAYIIKRGSITGYKKIDISNQAIDKNLKNHFIHNRLFSTSSNIQNDIQLLESNLENLQINEEENGNFSKIEIFEDDLHGPDKDFLKEQYKIIYNLERQNKNNEIFAIYLRIKSKNIIPNLEILNMVLKSIPLRIHTFESTEENLTNLLDVYSDMLSWGIKPNQTTFKLVILPLLDGSIKSYLNKDSEKGEQFFKIANELFNVTLSNKYNFPTILYEKLLICHDIYNFAFFDLRKMSNLMLEKLGYDNLIYYLSFISLSKYSKDYEFAFELYKIFKVTSLSNEKLLIHQFEIYSSLIRTLIYCNQISFATKVLDEIIKNIRSKSGLATEIQPLLSSYLIGFSEIGLVDKSYEALVHFDAIPWLPKININSLMRILDKCCDTKDLNTALNVWTFIALRDEFDQNITKEDNSLINLMVNLTSTETKNTISKFIDLTLISGDSSNILKITKELLLKKSLAITDINVLLRLFNYLISIGEKRLALNLIIDQGYKSHLKSNQYLSIIVDYVPTSLYPQLLSSKFFKQCCDDYRLVNDNIYGIYKIMNWFFELEEKGKLNKESELFKKLKYYYKTIYNELDDLMNFYVEIPSEIDYFKKTLASKHV
ncbi:hypothetical protein PACTADRAFT_51752 [Pachysolen tannophilus NRRL Y-2460]|uniref:Uncharacterized protein n=1 Tax=Pachysolen tannophilus NRRL Y-2460 TaxID=669874 RepID=A0A1E4TQJ3_PACTA|nr:hypothetical protein PACTADRAFT_51752 [Pachysolen tannophilus NRRL Y-2460]